MHTPPTPPPGIDDANRWWTVEDLTRRIQTLSRTLWRGLEKYADRQEKVDPDLARAWSGLAYEIDQLADAVHTAMAQAGTPRLARAGSGADPDADPAADPDPQDPRPGRPRARRRARR
jgi:hypothetical protein